MSLRKFKFVLIKFGFIIFTITLTVSSLYAQADLGGYIESVEQAQKGMSFAQMIQAGGIFIYILFALSIGVGACVVYNFMTLREDNLIPRTFTDSLIKNLEEEKYYNVDRMCEVGDNLIMKIVKSGFMKKSKGLVYVREAMENNARREIGSLWQNISYLSDIATIAPLVGLLGTVIGMIQAFNVIAFQTAVVKPILLAGGVSKAMITTAGGLIVAIPALIFYAYFRGRVQFFSDTIETYTTDIIKILEDSWEGVAAEQQA